MIIKETVMESSIIQIELFILDNGHRILNKDMAYIFKQTGVSMKASLLMVIMRVRANIYIIMEIIT